MARVPCGRLVATVGAACLLGGIVLLGGASARPAEAFRVGFHVTAVSKTRPPNIVEIRVAGRGSLHFNTAPRADQRSPADGGTGVVVVDYDVLAPHPRTERVALTVQK